MNTIYKKEPTSKSQVHPSNGCHSNGYRVIPSLLGLKSVQAEGVGISMYEGKKPDNSTLVIASLLGKDCADGEGAAIYLYEGKKLIKRHSTNSKEIATGFRSSLLNAKTFAMTECAEGKGAKDGSLTTTTLTTAKVADHCQRIDHQPVIASLRGKDCADGEGAAISMYEGKKPDNSTPVIASGRVGDAKGSEAICLYEEKKLIKRHSTNSKQIAIPCGTGFLHSPPCTKTFAMTVVAFFLLFGAGQLSAQEVLIEDFESYSVESDCNGKINFTS